MREMIRAFRNLGHEVEPVIAGGEEPAYDSTSRPTIARRVKDTVKTVVPAVCWESLRDYRLVQKDRDLKHDLIEVVDSFGPDLIYERSAYLQNSGVRVAEKFGIPHVLEVNAPLAEERETLVGTASWLQQRAERVEAEKLRRTEHVLIVSETLQHEIQEKYKVDQKKITVTHNAINPEKARSDKSRVKEVSAKYNLSDKFVVGFVGSVFPWHGIDLLIEASQKLADAVDNLQVLIVGDGSIVPDLKDLRDEQGLSERIHFTGRVPHSDVFNFIDVMDVTVSPKSHWYGSPVKIFEYGAMEKPIVAPRNGPVSEVMEDGTDGLLVDADVDELYEALRTLAEQESLREKIAQNFHRKVLKNHTWKQNARKVLSSIAHKVNEYN
jgi:glycosyltransferase involved in cell wall biosynthesis